MHSYDDLDNVSTAVPTDDNNTASNPSQLLAIAADHQTAAVQAQAEAFLSQIEKLVERWLARSDNPHTQRNYRRDLVAFLQFQGWVWPQDAWQLLQTTVEDVLAWRDYMTNEMNYAPNTINRRLASLTSLYRYLRETAAEAKLPVNLHNPAQRDFIRRPSAEPVMPTRALKLGDAHKLLQLPKGDAVLALRDRAVLAFYLYTGARISTGCRLDVNDLVLDEEQPLIYLQEKGHGRRKRPLGIHHKCAHALQDYLDEAALSHGPLFRAQRHSRLKQLGRQRISQKSMWRLLTSYLKQLPQAVQTVVVADGTMSQRCVYSPHSLRATTATLLLDEGVDITEVQALLGHAQVTTTQIYDKRRRQAKSSASHRMPV